MTRTRILLAGAALGAVSAVAVVACGDDTASSTTTIDSGPRVIHPSNDAGELEDIEFDTIIIDVPDRGEIPCIIWKDGRGSDQSRYAYSGLDCDWSNR